jgi:hypothetical protein
MDENGARQRFVSRRPDSSNSAPSWRSPDPESKRRKGSDSTNGRGSGLLSRFGTSNLDGRDEEAQADPEYAPPAPASERQPPRISMPAKDARQSKRDAPPGGRGRGPLQAFGGQARRLGDNFRRAAMRNRKPGAGNWRASDFDPEVLEAWDRHGSVPFALPEDPDARDDPDDLYDDTYDTPPARRQGRARTYNRAENDWDEDEYTGAGWDAGTWDTGWATDYQPSVDGWDREGDPWRSGRSRRRDKTALGEGKYGQTMGTIAVLGSVGETLGRVARVRLLLRRRPTAAALLSFLLLGLVLTACAPLVPLLRLGLDTDDAYHRVQTLQALFADGSASLLNTAKLTDAQTQVDALSHDLYEINSVVSSLGAPLAALSPQLRDDRLLVRLGFDLTASADEGLQVAQTILTPLQGGALATTGSSPGITPADLQQASAVLADATVRVADAEAAYAQLDPAALPSQLRPDTRLGSYLRLLPLAPQVVAELSALLQSVPALLGVGQPAYYLVMALDRSELRPVGGFAGNYGILELDGGRQSATHPFSLSNVYDLDQQYFQANLPPHPAGDCAGQGPQPPQYYWWWPYRNLNCQYGWGLRDSGLSPSFPIDAQTAMQIVQDTPGKVPGTAPLQGVVAFTPILIEQLMKVTGTITLSQWGNVVVTPQNLEYLIHKYQLVLNTGQADRKAFTHDLSLAMLHKIKTLHGSQLRTLFTIVEQALKSKDLELYLADPHAELILQQLGLAADIRTGNGDGFYVVDTNDGGDKANAFVSEEQTDVVTLLPNGGALHHLQIAVTYNRKGLVFSSTTDDYLDMQRTYLPADATILGYSGFNTPFYTQFGIYGNCIPPASASIVDCSDGIIHNFSDPVTESDVPGRTMIMGALTVNCGPNQGEQYSLGSTDSYACQNAAVSNMQTIYLEWYTPHAFTPSADGHGTYTEVVEEQPGSGDFLLGVGDYLTVYVDTSQLHTARPTVDTTPVIDAAGFQKWTANLSPVHGFNHVPLDQDLTVSLSF